MLNSKVIRDMTLQAVLGATFAASFGLLALTGCKGEKTLPKSETETSGNRAATPAKDAPVFTENPGYDRQASHVLVRRIVVPTTANLDYAAYAQNVMLFDPEPFEVAPAQKVGLADLRFGGVAVDVRASLAGTNLTDEEQASLIAFTPALDRLLQWDFAKVAPFADAYSKITGEKWGDTSDVPVAYQEIAALAFHVEGDQVEVWARLEFKPFMAKHLSGLAEGAGFPEAWLRLDPQRFTAAMAKELLGDYSSKVLGEAEVQDWARNLTSRWYPSYNTDLVEVKGGEPWPYADVPSAVKQELGTFQVAAPAVIFKGRPFEDTLFNVFVLGPKVNAGATTTAGASSSGGNAQKNSSEGADSSSGVAGGAAGIARQVDSGASERAQAMANSIDKQVKAIGGGSFTAWHGKLKGFHQGLRAFAQREPETVQGLVGLNDFLVFRREIDYLLAPDWQASEAKHHPMPVIVALKNQLAAQGIDFLFIPIPTKLDVYPEMVGPVGAKLPGGSTQPIAQPYVRKVLADLGREGVETLDLLSPMLAEKAGAKANTKAGENLLYQKQDTHWSSEGLQLAAKVMASRIREYAWHDAVFAKLIEYAYRDTTYAAFGDIQARLSDKAKSEVKPETLNARRVFVGDKPYVDATESPVLVLGDSYTGVFQTVGCRNAGVTAHLAAELKGPVDLIMGWGGGPEAPRKLAQRGPEYLGNKRLVVWMMSARDLFAYPGDWK
jgi:SGNH hydrolase-like domain, acetyltransferase AlgX